MPTLKRLSRKQYVRLLAYRLDALPPTGRKGKKLDQRLRDHLEDMESVKKCLGMLAEQMDRPDIVGHIGYENLAMDSSSFGQRQFMPVGPNNTLKTIQSVIEEPGMGRPLGQSPSQFCYPQYFWQKPVTDEDVEWERLQDAWDAEHPYTVGAIGTRNVYHQATAESWIAAQLLAWRAKQEQPT